MNKDFYKQRISDVINMSFAESQAIQLETLVHPNKPNLRAKQVLSLLPCSELLGQTIFDVHLGNKLEKTKENELLNEEGLLANIGFNEFQEKTFKLYQKKEEDSRIEIENEEMVQPDAMERIAEYGVLRKKMGQDDEQRMLLMVVNNEKSAEIKEMDYSLFLRNKKKLIDAEELLIEDDMEEETRFKKDEQDEVQDLSSFLSKRLSQLYPSSEGILWDKPHPPAKKHKPSQKEEQRVKTNFNERISEEVESVDSLLED